MNKYTTVNAN